MMIARRRGGRFTETSRPVRYGALSVGSGPAKFARRDVGTLAGAAFLA